MTFLLVGGDERQVYLAKRLAVSNRVLLYGMGEQALSVPGGEILRFPEAGQLREVEVLVLPVPAIRPDGNIYAPFSQIKLELLPLLQMLPAGVRVLGGKIGPVCAAQIASCGFTYEDVLLREDFAVKNAVPTAEGTIQILMEELPQTIDGMKILLVGSGRISKILRRKLHALGAAVSVCCRRSEEAAWALADGCEVLEPEALASCVRLADAVINTVPAKLLTEPVLRQIRPQTLVIDLASAPGGVQWPAASALGVRTIWAQSLPGKCAPERAGEILYETVCRIRKEWEHHGQ